MAARNRNYEIETNRNYLLNFLYFFNVLELLKAKFFLNIYFATHLESAVWSSCTTHPSLGTPLLRQPQSWL